MDYIIQFKREYTAEQREDALRQYPEMTIVRQLDSARAAVVLMNEEDYCRLFGEDGSLRPAGLEDVVSAGVNRRNLPPPRHGARHSWNIPRRK